MLALCRIVALLLQYRELPRAVTIIRLVGSTQTTRFQHQLHWRGFESDIPYKPRVSTNYTDEGSNRKSRFLHQLRWRGHNQHPASTMIKAGLPCTGHIAVVTSDRTNLSPFTKDYRGGATCMRLDLFMPAARRYNTTTTKSCTGLGGRRVRFPFVPTEVGQQTPITPHLTVAQLVERGTVNVNSRYP